MKAKNLPKLNAVIGHPLAHSKSPVLHSPVYKELGLDAVILPFDNPDIGKLVSAIRTLPIHLTAVTMPFKQKVISYLDTVDPVAKKIKAVNTIINKNGRLHGYNTDIDGVRYALRHCPLKGRRVLLIGAGGAACAIACFIREKEGQLLYLNRTMKKAGQLQKLFGGRVVKLKELNSNSADVIINATPIGMYPRTNKSPLPKNLLRKDQTVFDLVYNPLETRLLKEAKNKGAKTISGLEMFVAQGLRQIELWTGRKIIRPSLVKKLRKLLI